MAQLTRLLGRSSRLRSQCWWWSRPVLAAMLATVAVGALVYGFDRSRQHDGDSDSAATSPSHFTQRLRDQRTLNLHWRLDSLAPVRYTHPVGAMPAQSVLEAVETTVRDPVGMIGHALSLQPLLPHASDFSLTGLKESLIRPEEIIHPLNRHSSSTLLPISLALVVSTGMAFAIIDARNALSRAQQDIRRLRKATVKAMTLVASAHDDETGAHLQRCSLYAKVMGQQLQFEGMPIDDDYVEALAVAVPLHDIGKVGIPDSVLKKPGKHNIEEQITMRLHPEIGCKIIALLGEEADIKEKLVFEIAKDVTIAHHENWDGSGYPAGLRGESIPLAARIMAIIDVYDAVSSRRCYKEGRSHEEVVRIIRDLSWSKFDPMLVDSFLSVSDQFRRIFEENPDHSLISESSRGALAGPAVADPVGRL